MSSITNYETYRGYQIDNSYYRLHLSENEIKLRNRLITCKSGEERVKMWDELLNPDKVKLKNGQYKLDRQLTVTETNQIKRILCKIDRIYLMMTTMDNTSKKFLKKYLTNQWLYDRMSEVERLPDGHLDLWPRSHGKTNSITVYGSIQEILINPNITILILTYTGKFGLEVISAIKNILENSEPLKDLFPDILFKDPKKEAKAGRWMQDKFYVKGAGSRFPTMTYSSVDNMKTGVHFQLRIYDDIVVPASVTTQENRDKSMKMIDLSKNLGSPGMGKDHNRQQFVGTYYHKNDAYTRMVKNSTVIERRHPATHNGKIDGNPVFMSPEEWGEWKPPKVDPYVVATQMLLDPNQSDATVFSIKELKPFNVIKPMHIFILVDPASTKGKKSDYTSMAVIGVYNDGRTTKKYLLDGIKDKLNLKERWDKLKSLHEKWFNYLRVFGENRFGVYVFYEKSGMQSDIESFKLLMNNEGVYFDINAITPYKEKTTRIRRLLLDFKQGTFFIPAYTCNNGEYNSWKYYENDGMESLHFERLKNQNMFPNIDDYELYNYHDVDFDSNYNHLQYPLKKVNYEGITYDYTIEFIQQYENFPNLDHEDILDSFSMLYDIPDLNDYVVTRPRVYYADGS